MLEKSSTIVLTKNDLELYNQGIVSERLQQQWQLSLDELRQLVQTGNYVEDTKND